MPSRKIAAFLALLVLSSSCSWTRDRPKPLLNLQKGALDLSCLQRAVPALKELFQGQMTDSPADQARASEVWTCLDHALDVFSTLTTGKKSDVWGADELQSFANHFLKEEQRINDSFRDSIFDLKTLVLGGAQNQITRSEIQKLRANLTRFGGALTPLAPHLSTLLHPGTRASNEKKAAMEALQRFADALAAIFSESLNPVEWDRLSGFARNLESYLHSEGSTALTFLQEQTGILRHLKVLWVGGSDRQLEQKMWKPILDGLVGLLGTFLLADHPRDWIEKFSLEFHSTPEEQSQAIQSLGVELRRLKADPGLRTRSFVLKMADLYIKGRLLREIALPDGKKPVSLNVLFRQSRLRSSENRLLQTLFSGKGLEMDAPSPATWIDRIRELLKGLDQTLYEQTGKNPSFSLENLRKVCSDHLDLFADPREGNRILGGIPLFIALRSVLSHQAGDEVRISELDPLLEKIRQFLEQPWQRDRPFSENYRRLVEALRRKPSVDQIDLSALQAILPQIAPILRDITGFQSSPDEISRLLSSLFEQKNLLWGGGKDRFRLADFDEVGFLIEQKDTFRKDPMNGIRALDSRWKRPNHTPTLQLDAWEEILQNPLLRVDGFDLWKQAPGMFKALRILRRFSLGTENPQMPLAEIAEMEALARQAREGWTSREFASLAALLEGRLALPETLHLTFAEMLHLLATAETLRPGSTASLSPLLRPMLSLKHALLGTPEDALVREDFAFLRQWLIGKSEGTETWAGFLALLEKNGKLEDSRLDLKSIRDLLAGFPEETPTLPGLPLADVLALLDEAIELKKNWFADPSPVLNLRDVRNWLDRGARGETLPPLPRAQAILSMALEILAPRDFTKTEILSLLGRVSGWLERFGRKPLPLETLSRQIDLFLQMKSQLLGGSPEILTRSDLGLAHSLIEAWTAEGPRNRKTREVLRILEPRLAPSIGIAELATTLRALDQEFHFSRQLPIPLTEANLRRLKLLTVGGSSRTLTSAELLTLARKSLTAKSPEEWITPPAFRMDAASLRWIENALLLAKSSGKSFGLKDAYGKMEEHFQKRGVPIRLPLEKSLYGIWEHVFEGKKGILPLSSGSTPFALTEEHQIRPEHLGRVAELVRSIRIRLEDLEQAYSGNRDILLSRTVLLSRLKNAENRRHVKTFVPTLRKMGGKPQLRLEANMEAGGEFLLEDLASKAVLGESLDFLFRAYSLRSLPSLSTPEFALLLNDLRIPMIQFGLLYKSGPPAVVAAKQMEAINLFTRTGNGNSMLELDETVEFMSTALGTGESFRRLILTLSGKCRQKDVQGIPGFEGSCVTRNLFLPEAFRQVWGESIPGMTETYAALTGSRKTRFDVAILKLTGKNLLQERPRSLLESFEDRTLEDYSFVDFDYDMLQSIHSVPPLLESVFQMMDRSNNERIELSEALAFFPRFCPAIQKAAKGKIQGSCATPAAAKELKKLYGYLLVHKERPGVGFYFWDSDWVKIQSGARPFSALTRFDLITILSNLAP